MKISNIMLNQEEFPFLRTNCNGECITLTINHSRELRINLEYTNMQQ